MGLSARLDAGLKPGSISEATAKATATTTAKAKAKTKCGGLSSALLTGKL